MQLPSAAQAQPIAPSRSPPPLPPAKPQQPSPALSKPPEGPPDDALATSHVGNYTLYATIGEGAFGKVKLAVHRETNQRVAIKIMDKNEIREQEFTAQVRREIYIMRKLKHKHIVLMHEVLTSDTKLYIVMELVTGGELFHRIENGRVPESLARQYFQQLVDGVDFCHKKGVAHRDLKPENLLVDENGDIKITDFGFSSMKGMDVNAGLLYTQCGTPDYCAPEIIECAREGYNGAKVDAWSCGIILYALLCGRLPFQEQDTEKLYDLILACKVHYPPQISPSARDLLQNLLVRDPNKRYDLQKVKRHPWFQVDYDGDDARLIKKRPFFNKHQKDLTNSNPSSPMNGSQNDGQTSAPPSVATTAAATAAAAVHSPVVMQNGYDPVSPNRVDLHYSANNDIAQNTISHAEVTRNSAETKKHPLQPHAPPESLHVRNSPAGGRIGPIVPRGRDEFVAMYKPPSPANEIDATMRAPTPPMHEVIRRVEDRPATPARRQTAALAAAAFKAATAAAAVHANPPNVNGHIHTHNVPSPVGYGLPARISPSLNGYKDQTISNDSNGPNPYEITPGYHRHDDHRDVADSSSDQDSTEDYEDKPALNLELPMVTRFRSVQEPRRGQLHIQQDSKQRHRSDLGITSAAPASLASPNDGPFSDPHRQRRGLSSNGMPGTEHRAPRIARPSDLPSSPPVVYSPSGVNVSAFDRRRSISPGYNASRGGPISDGSPNSGYFSGVSGLHPGYAWQANGASYASNRDGAGNNSSPGALHIEVFSRHLWNMICKLRGTTEPANQKLSMELRADFRLLIDEMNQLTKVEDKAAILTSFLSLFETLGLSEGPVSSPNSVRTQTRSHAPSDMDEDFEDGGTIESREEPLSSNGDPKYASVRRTGTDMSSEEEPLSWSPVLAEVASRNQSDLARRRNMSDLLNMWIKKIPGQRPDSTGDKGGFGGEDEESSSAMDLMELQRLMREQQSGREESNLADELLKLMNPDTTDDGGIIPFGNTIGQPGQSPPAPAVQTTRSADSYTQKGRYGVSSMNANIQARSNAIRSNVGNSTQLPSEYVPGRFQEPNSMPVRGALDDHQSGFSRRGRSELSESGDTHALRNKDNMAGSMGMHDIAYYGSDKKSGMATKLRGVLQTMKAKNQKLGEYHCQFRSSVPPDMIMRILGRILVDMGADVTIKKETKRKMKCQLAMEQNWVLHAGIELLSVEDGITSVSFRRSRNDRGRTDTEAFHSFFVKVRNKFIEEANVQKYPQSGSNTSSSSGRRRGHTNGRSGGEAVSRVSTS